MKPIRRHLGLAVAAAAVGAALAQPANRPPASQPAGKETQAAGNLEYWLGRAKAVTSQPAATQPTGINPFRQKREFFRADALPGVIELSNGKQLPGGLYTTREKPWLVWSQPTKSWRRVPLINLLSITAVVVEERMELRWRWKGMGEPEKVYTGKSYPFRRVRWRFKLIDGSVLEGPTKGQPLWVELRGKATGPFVLHERSKGQDGQTLKDLVYVRKVVISRRMMQAVIADREKQFRKASGGRGGSPPRKRVGQQN